MINHSKLTLQDLSYVALAIILTIVMIASATTSSVPKYDLLIEVEVNDGDTLWSIANNYAEEISTQAYITLIRNHNNLQGDTIYAGQILLVPQLENNKVVKHEEGNYLLSSKY